ncbi:MAG TPA: PspC domain-containing protein [Bacteroidia bacterium]|nr:PspC domain-containing protein [Bacteroidia bacterium]
MNKTVTINISGIIFHIEEDAFEKLSRYLSTIKQYFSHLDGGAEIMSDIEARIAELLQEKLNPGKQVILMADVNYAMDTMGKPEDFGGDAMKDAMQDQPETEGQQGEPIKKRLYRDPDNKVLGGVCSGIGHYFGFDPVWLRVALALLLVFAGTGILIYIILWIAIPEASTTAEKLAMKGERIDINNISRTVKEEAEQLRKRMEKYGKDLSKSSPGSEVRTVLEKIIDAVVTICIGIGKFLIKVLGFFLFIFGIIFFFGLFTSLFGISFINNLAFNEWVDMFLLEGKDFFLGVTGLFLFLTIPVLAMIYGGMKLLFKFSYSNRWLNLSASILWLIGLVMLLYVGMRTGQDFNKTAKVRERVEVTGGPVLSLKLNEVPLNYEELNSSDLVEEGERNYRHHRGESNYAIGAHGDMKYLIGHAQLNIIKSQSDRVELLIVKEAKGGSKQMANDRAKNILYHAAQRDSDIVFDNIFRVNNADKFRFQNVTAILKLPVGQIIYLDKSVENLIYDVENVSNTYDGDMIGRRWIMSKAGLECLDCEGLEDATRFDEDAPEVRIDKNGLNIHSGDSKIKMDSDGVKIHSKESKVIIDREGVHVREK